MFHVKVTATKASEEQFSGTDSITITVEASAPLATIAEGSAMVITAAQQLILNGSVSIDPDNTYDTLVYTWTCQDDLGQLCENLTTLSEMVLPSKSVLSIVPS